MAGGRSTPDADAASRLRHSLPPLGRSARAARSARAIRSRRPSSPSAATRFTVPRAPQHRGRYAPLPAGGPGTGCRVPCGRGVETAGVRGVSAFRDVRHRHDRHVHAETPRWAHPRLAGPTTCGDPRRTTPGPLAGSPRTWCGVRGRAFTSTPSRAVITRYPYYSRACLIMRGGRS